MAANAAMRSMALPALDVWESILARPVHLEFREDNQTCITIIKTGKSSTIQHITRTHGISISLLHEIFQDPNISIVLSGEQWAVCRYFH